MAHISISNNGKETRNNSNREPWNKNESFYLNDKKSRDKEKEKSFIHHSNDPYSQNHIFDSPDAILNVRPRSNTIPFKSKRCQIKAVEYCTEKHLSCINTTGIIKSNLYIRGRNDIEQLLSTSYNRSLEYNYLQSDAHQILILSKEMKQKDRNEGLSARRRLKSCPVILHWTFKTSTDETTVYFSRTNDLPLLRSKSSSYVETFSAQKHMDPNYYENTNLIKNINNQQTNNQQDHWEQPLVASPTFDNIDASKDIYQNILDSFEDVFHDDHSKGTLGIYSGEDPLDEEINYVCSSRYVNTIRSKRKRNSRNTTGTEMKENQDTVFQDSYDTLMPKDTTVVNHNKYQNLRSRNPVYDKPLNVIGYMNWALDGKPREYTGSKKWNDCELKSSRFGTSNDIRHILTAPRCRNNVKMLDYIYAHTLRDMFDEHNEYQYAYAHLTNWGQQQPPQQQQQEQQHHPFVSLDRKTFGSSRDVTKFRTLERSNPSAKSDFDKTKNLNTKSRKAGCVLNYSNGRIDISGLKTGTL